MDAHTTYYLPSGYGAVYFTTPFAIKPRLVNGEQKFYTSEPPYPFDFWEIVCGSNCPYSDSMEGWEISQINGTDVPTFIKSFSRGGGTYYDDGVRANAFITTGWGQTSLTATNMPPASFTVTLINPSNNSPTTMTLPFGFGGSSGFNRAAMINANRHSSSKRSELFAERLLLESLQQESARLRKRSDLESAKRASAVEGALQELTTNMARIEVDSLLTHAILERDGSKALFDDSLPFIPTPRQRMEDVFRLQSVLFPRKEKSAAKIEAENKEFEAYVARETKYRMENSDKKKKAATDATEIPIVAGSSSKWSMYTSYPSSPANAYEGLSAYYGSYDGTTVLRLGSFSYTNADRSWVTSVTNAVTQRSSRNLNDNLIIDVTNNGGGSVCLNYWTMSYLVEAWSNLRNIVGSDVVYSLYDIRMSPLLTLLYQRGYITGENSGAFNRNDGTYMSTSYYTNPVTRTIGGNSASYTQAFQWNPCGTQNQYFNDASYHFNKIIVITDGRCGSSCAYFVTQLRENNKVRLVSYGGLYDEPLATSSFAGGNVYNWDLIRSVTTAVPANPFSSYIAYNIRENFSPSQYPNTPRQFDRLEADYYLPFWDSFYRFYNTDNNNVTARFTLYESVLAQFGDVPSGLPRTAASPAIQSGPVPNAASAVTFSGLIALLAALIALLL